MRKQAIILIGPPGAGKGTQAELLADKLGLYHFETSRILEQKFKGADSLPPDSKERIVKVGNEEYDMSKELEIWKTGRLCSPPFVVFLVKEKIKELFSQDKSLVFSGSPRTLFEGKELAPFLKDLYGPENVSVISINISPEATIFRNSHRRICELMRHSILYSKETEKLSMCPLDGSKLVRREGLDDPETIKVRLKEYKERTLPLIEYLETENLKMIKIKGEQSVSDVFKDILKEIE
jgi:adenylate kinase